MPRLRQRRGEIMRIIHCADLHLGAAVSTHSDSAAAEKRRSELLGNFVRLAAAAEAGGVRAILLCGDLFDTENSPETVIRTVQKTIASHPGILFFYLRGNHDERAFLPELSRIPENLRLFPDHFKTYDLSGGITVSGCELRAHANASAEGLRLFPDRINIVMLHGMLVEYGREHFPRSGSELISLPDFRNRNVDYLALGHLHAYEEGRLDGRGTWCYSGCLEGRGFDECGRHGYVLLDIDEETREIRRQFVDFAGRRIYALEADVSGLETSYDMADRIREVLRHPSRSRESESSGLGMTLTDLAEYGYGGASGGFPAAECGGERTESGSAGTGTGAEGVRREDLVRITLTGALPVNAEKSLSFLQETFAPAYFCFRLEDQTHLSVDYREYAHDESLKGEFVRLIERDPALTEDRKAEIIRCGIQALAGQL